MVSDQVLANERAFFDREAASLADRDLLIPSDQIERYRQAGQGAGNISKDTLFANLLPLEGKAVLDYGCGHGENAILLAACGAQVTAFDLSPESVAKARRRAELHGLADRIQVDERAAGQTDYPPASFDVVTGFAILHHLHWMLPAIYTEVARVLKPGGVACFTEPVANSSLLRALRPLIPVKSYATPEERQLVYQDLEPLREHFASVEVVHFYCLERLHRLLGDWVRRPLRRLDHHAQRLVPLARRYYGEVLVIARR